MVPHYEKGSSTNVGKLIVAKSRIMVDCTSMTSYSLPKVTFPPRNFSLVAPLFGMNFFLHTNMGVGGGARILKISAKKAVFLVSSGKKQISPLLPP